MKIVVVGATGGSGRAAVEELARRGHEVTALARQPERMTAPAGVRMIAGDALRAADLDEAVRGQDAVVVTLGIRENALAVRLRGRSTGTPLNVRSAGTAGVIEAMRRNGVRKLVVLSSYGVGESRNRLPWKWRTLFWLLLKPQIADTEVQEQLVRSSGVKEWVIAQPVALTDADSGASTPLLASAEGEVRSMSVSRRSVARFLAEAVENGKYDGCAVALSE